MSLVVPAGSVFALLGSNGAGKSTVLKVASGRLEPTSGCLHVAGIHVNGADPDRLARAGVCTIPEGRGIFPNLTRHREPADDDLPRQSQDARRRGARLRPVPSPRRSGASSWLGTLSGGEQQMLAMARALTSEPSLLLLDEISMGLAPIIVAQLYDLVRQLSDEGISILVVEQFAQTALAIADYAAVMAHGVITRVGQPQDVSDEVSAAYLGGAA